MKQGRKIGVEGRWFERTVEIWAVAVCHSSEIGFNKIITELHNIVALESFQMSIIRISEHKRLYCQRIDPNRT